MAERTVKEIFDEQGYYGPVRFLATHKIQEYQNEVYRLMREMNWMNTDYRCKANVLFPFINEISKSIVIVDYVKQILGPNFSCWDTLVWIKYPQSDNYVSWHQDATYWNFLPKEKGLTVWATLSGATKEMGCLQYVPGSHKQGQSKHSDIKTDENLLMRGQTIDEYSKDNIVHVEARPGTFIMHSPFTVHGSDVNRSETPRVAIGFIYVATDAKPIATFSPESTVMVSGVDEYNYMLHDPEPTGNWEQDIKVWKQAYDRQHDNYYKMEQVF
jgi:non-heme Fe2+,alpha-ketoglutarate-dependent halogenase